MKRVFIGKAVGAKFIANNSAMVHDYLYKLESKEIRVTIEETTLKTRSLDQNNFYWLYLEMISQETGDDANSLHELFKRLFLPPKSLKVLSRDIKIPGSTTDLEKIPFGEYLDRICALTGVPIPDTEIYKKDADSAPLINE